LLPASLVRSIVCFTLAFIIVIFRSQTALLADAAGDSSRTFADSAVPGLAGLIDPSLRVPLVDFKAVSISDALAALLRPNSINVWVSPEVTGTITVYLTDVPLIDAVQLIIAANKLRYGIDQGILKVYQPAISDLFPLEVSFDNDLLSLDFVNVPLDVGVPALIGATGRNIIVQKGTTGSLSGKLRDIAFDKGVSALFSSNGFATEIREGITYISRPPAEGTGSLRSSYYEIRCDSGKVTLDVRNADLQRLIENIAAKCGVQLVQYGLLSGSVSISCIRLNIEDVFNLALRGSEYTFKRDGEVFQFGSTKIEQLRTNQFVKLNHLVADDVIGIIPAAISAKVAVHVVKEQNGLMASGPYDAVRELSDFVQAIDFAPAQIVVEALVVDFSTSYLNQFSIVSNNTGQTAAGATDEKYYPDIQLYSAGKQADNGLQEIASHLGITKIGHLSDNFYVQLKALAQEGKANIRSRPVIASLNGHEASINIGTTQYYLLKTETVFNSTTPSYTSQVSQRFETIKADVSLKVTPWVTGTGEIIVDIQPEFNTPRGQLDPNIPPTINHRLLNSTVRLRPGETIVLGGLIQSNEDIQVSKLPILGEIPILGRLFQNRSKTSTETELMIFLTPTVYYASEGAVDISKYKKQ
jgi:type IV pilus assembly protein PilQ